MSEFDKIEPKFPRNARVVIEKNDSDDDIPLCGDCVPEEEQIIPPVDRIITPRDVTDINAYDDIIYVIGTRGEKVTKIRHLEEKVNLKVMKFHKTHY